MKDIDLTKGTKSLDSAVSPSASKPMKLYKGPSELEKARSKTEKTKKKILKMYRMK